MIRWPWGRNRNARPMQSLVWRGFQAAQTDRLLANWRYDGGFTPQEIISALDIIRARSRQMAKDSALFRRWLELCAINIVGEGFVLKSTPHDGVPGAKDYRLDEAAAALIEYHWWRFCNYRDPQTGLTWCDVTGRKTDSEIDRLNVKTQRRDGEYFLRIIRGAPNPYGIAWQVLRPDWCDHTYNIPDTGHGTAIHCGVEMEMATRRPVAYWFCTQGDTFTTVSPLGRKLIPIPASEIIHGFRQEDEYQPRGIPESHAVLVRLKMIEELDRAELTAARDSACTVRVYEADTSASQEVFADLTAEDNANVATALLQEKEPGQGEIVPPGWKMRTETPQHPNSVHAPFKAGIIKDVASGLGVEYCNFANDWAGASFSSVRVGTISERDAWIVAQNEYINRCKTPQFLAWLKSFLSLSVSGGLPPEKYDKFSEHYFRGRRWTWVDPMKDMAAAKIARDHGWKTDTQITEELGGDYSDNLDAMKREKAMRQQAGLPEPKPEEGQV